jgi:hypothetical protein
MLSSLCKISIVSNSKGDIDDALVRVIDYLQLGSHGIHRNTMELQDLDVDQKVEGLMFSIEELNALHSNCAMVCKKFVEVYVCQNCHSYIKDYGRGVGCE